jgi:DNA-binding MurR/RpiR family transcriptional regulator
VQTGNGFFEKIKDKGHELSPKQKQLAKYILDNYKKAAFQKLTQLARGANVSEATVVRLTTSLGYSGFSDMMEDLQKMVRHELDVFDRIKYSAGKKELNILETVASNEMGNINKLLESISVEQIQNVANVIEKSDKIIVAGFNFSSFFAEFTVYNLGKVKPNVYIINSGNYNNLNNFLLSCNPSTAVILFSFPRYPKKIQQLGELFKERGATIIGISDSILSPLKVVSDNLLLIPLNNMSFVDPCSSVLLVVQAIIMEYMSRNPQSTEEKLNQFDYYAEKMNIF